MSVFVPPGACPNCGDEVPAGASACPHCGADARAGWDEEATHLDGVGLPEDAGDNYERTVERELGDGLPRGGRAWLAFGLAVLLALLLGGAWRLLR